MRVHLLTLCQYLSELSVQLLELGVSSRESGLQLIVGKRHQGEQLVFIGFETSQLVLDIACLRLDGPEQGLVVLVQVDLLSAGVL